MKKEEILRALRLALPVMLTACLLLLIYARALEGGWRWDDPQILLFADRYDWFEYIFVPEIWQQFSLKNLTPLVILSFEADLALFGLSPYLFYLHQLIALVVICCMLYLCLQLWCSKLLSMAASLFFLTGLPVMVVVEQLMTRHYVEGLLLALLSIYGFVKYLRTSHRFFLLLSLLAYGLACIAKEVYVPMPLLLLCIPDGANRQRALASVPYFVILLIYTLWRIYMLNGLGGYNESSSYFDIAFLKQVVMTFANFPMLLAGRLWPLALSLWLVLLAIYLVISRRPPWRAMIIALLVLTPLLPLVPGIAAADRYLFVVWATLSFAVAFMADQIIKNSHPNFNFLPQSVTFIVIASLIGINLAHALPMRNTISQVNREFDVQGRFLFSKNASVSFLTSMTIASHFHFITGLRDIKSGLKIGSSPIAIIDGLFLSDIKSTQIWEWQSECACMVDISGQLESRQSRFTKNLRDDAPMLVRYNYQDGVFSWQFNTATQGRWHAISNIFGVIPLPESGRLRVQLPKLSSFYVRYTSPDGWFSYTDELHIKFDGEEKIWSRGLLDDLTRIESVSKPG